MLDFPGYSFAPGRVCAVIGANGSGKSTLARILAGVIPADGGPFRDGGGVGYMPQKSYPFRMSLRANLLLNGGRGEGARADRLLAALGLEGLAGQGAHRLSGGETARMALARLMMRRYGTLILDEPTAAMDVQSTIRAEEQILAYRAETGCAVILVTHSLKQAGRLADEVLFLHGGRLWEHGAAAAVLEAPARAETRQFLEYYGL